MSVKFDGTGRKKHGGSAIYIAIGLCAAAICLVGVSAFINNRQAQESTPVEDFLSQTTDEWLGEEVSEDILSEESVEADTQPLDSADAQPASTDEDIFAADAVEAAASSTAQTTSAPVTTTTAADNQPAAVKKTAFRPIEGELQKGFSANELVFCSTMGDWRVHEGVDIAGEAGAAVHAACDGVVYDVVEDVLYGHTVIVLGSDESMLYYCGLSGTALVTKGMEIKAGDIIGTLDVVPCEAGDAPHLHLAMMSSEGGFVDPAAALGL